MTKSLKKLCFTLALIGMMVLTFSPSIFALSSEKTDGPTVVRAFIVKDGTIREMNSDEYEIFMSAEMERQQKIEAEKSKLKNLIKDRSTEKGKNDSNKVNDDIGIQSILDLSYYDEFQYLTNVIKYDQRKRVSTIVHNNTSNPASRELSVSFSQSYTSSFSFSSQYQRNAFTAGVSAGAAWSNTYTRSDTVTQEVSPGHYSWMEYIPYMDNSLGTLYEEVWYVDQYGSTKIIDEVHWVEVFIAKSLNEIPDGIYTIMEDTVPPTH